MTPRLKDLYFKEIKSSLKDKFGDYGTCGVLNLKKLSLIWA